MKVRFKDENSRTLNINFMDAINNITVLTHVADELGLETESFWISDNKWMLRIEHDYDEDPLGFGIDVKKSKTLFEITDHNTYEDYEFVSTDLSDPKFATKMKKDIATKQKALKNLNKLQENFKSYIDRLAKMKI